MKILVFSIHNLDHGEGSKLRIFSMLDALTDLYGSSAVDWINVAPVGFNNRRKIKDIKKRYAYSGCPVKIFTPVSFAISAKLSLLSYTLFKIILFGRIYFKYRRQDNLIVWVERTDSYSVLEPLLRRLKHHLVVDVHGTSDEFINFVPENKPALDRYLSFLKKEISCLWAADGIVGVSDRMIRFFRSKYNSITANTIVIPTTPGIRSFVYSEEIRKKYRDQLQVGGRFLMVYSGGAQPYQCIDEMLLFFSEVERSAAFKTLQPKLLLLIWDKQFSLEDKCRSLNISADNIIVLSLNHSEVANYLQAADLGIVLRKDITTNHVASPTKICEYLLSGLPLLSTPYTGDVEQLIKEYQVGYVYEFHKGFEINAFADFCRDVLNQRAVYTQRCIAAANDYYSAQNFNKIAGLIDNMLEKP